MQTELAKRFNNTSVLETLSVEIAVQLLEKHQFFKAHQKSERYLYIKQVILSTDMVYHYELLEHASQLEQRISDLWLLGSSETSSSSSLGSDLDQTQRLTFACIILHASDISNTVRLWPISKQWSDLIVQEFFHQGDMEKQLGLTVSPGMDREVATQASISLTFGDQVVKPYFEALAALVPAASIFLETLDDNLYEWTHIKEEMPSPSSSFSMKPFNVPAGTLLQTKPIIRSSSYTCINTSFPHHTTLFRRKSAEHC